MPYKTRAEKNANAALYRARNRELLRERSRAYRAANPEMVATANAAYYAEHGDEERARARARHWANRDDRLRAAKAWAAANPVRVAALAAAGGGNARARRQGVPGRLTADDLEALWRRQPACRLCGAEVRGMDHIVAMANGGSNTPDNLQNLCKPCNRRKATAEHSSGKRAA